MENWDMDGVFGNGASVPPPQTRRDIRLPGEVVDWICSSLLAAAALLTILFWKPLSDALFFRLLFPLLSTGGQIAAIALLVLVLIRWLTFRLRWLF